MEVNENGINMIFQGLSKEWLKYFREIRFPFHTTKLVTPTLTYRIEVPIELINDWID